MRRAVCFLFIVLLALPLAAKGKRALLVGVSGYPAYQQKELTWHGIHGADDVAMVGSTLRRQGFHVATLTNAQATAKAIRKALAHLTRETQAGDIVYIHFSTHGQPYEDLDGDEADGWDEAIVPYDAGKRYIANAYKGGNHIIDDELAAYVNRIRKRAGDKGFVYVVVDACHSGGAARPDDDSCFVRGTRVGFSPHGKVYSPRRKDKTSIITRGNDMANVC